MRVTLVLTHQCNLGCDYCFAGRKFKRAMPWRTALQGLRLAFQGPAEEKVMIGFFGGEPMLEFELMLRITRVAVRLARRLGREVEFSLTCNGTVLEPRHLQFFRGYGFYVAISLDGLADEHDRHRPFRDGRSSAELVWRNLELAAASLSRLHVMAVVNPDTLEGLRDLVERLYRMGLTSLSLLPNLGAHWSEQARSRVAEVYGQLAELSFATLLTDEPFFITPFAELHPSWPRPIARCSFGSQDLAVSPAGNLYPCVRLVESDNRPEVRIGTVETGKQQPLLDRLLQRTRECGQRNQCRCVSLSAGAGPRDTDNQLFFADLARAATGRALRRWEELTCQKAS